jgi:hypothetical protein
LSKCGQSGKCSEKGSQEILHPSAPLATPSVPSVPPVAQNTPQHRLPHAPRSTLPTLHASLVVLRRCLTAPFLHCFFLTFSTALFAIPSVPTISTFPHPCIVQFIGDWRPNVRWTFSPHFHGAGDPVWSTRARAGCPLDIIRIAASLAFRRLAALPRRRYEGRVMENRSQPLRAARVRVTNWLSGASEPFK